MFRRIVSLFILAWLFGFLWFATILPRPAAGGPTDAVIVFTGGEGRIGRGLEAIHEGWTRKLLVSGVDREVREQEFQAEYEISDKLMSCCVTLGYQSFDTRSNAAEASGWTERNKLKSVRLVTTDWHMRRAGYELDRVKPPGVSVIRDAVSSQPSLRILFLEYHKYLARTASGLWS